MNCKCGRNFKNAGALARHINTCAITIEDVEQVQKLFKNGLSVSSIKDQCGFSRKLIYRLVKNIVRDNSIVISHKKKLTLKTCNICNRSFLSNFSQHVCVNDDDRKNIKLLYKSGLSVSEILTKGYKENVIKIVLRGKRRTQSEAAILSHKLHPENFKCSKQTKLILSNSRKLFLKNNPDAAMSWKRKSISYLEKLFQQLVEKNELTKKYDIVREYSIFPYFIDFAFVNIKLAVEIDGSQHWTWQSKIDRDKIRDEFLIHHGWKVYRIPEFLIKKEFEKTERDFLNYLAMLEGQPKLFDFKQEIIEYEKIKLLNEQNKIQLRQQNKQQAQFDNLNKQNLLIDKVLHADIDYSSFGWVGKVAKLLNKHPQKVNKWMKKYMLDFYEKNCFKREC